MSTDTTAMYKVIDKDGCEMPGKYGGNGYRTLQEAFNIVQKLNTNGEYKPYSIVSVEANFEIVKPNQ